MKFTNALIHNVMVQLHVRDDGTSSLLLTHTQRDEFYHIECAFTDIPAIRNSVNRNLTRYFGLHPRMLKPAERKQFWTELVGRNW